MCWVCDGGVSDCALAGVQLLAGLPRQQDVMLDTKLMVQAEGCLSQADAAAVVCACVWARAKTDDHVWWRRRAARRFRGSAACCQSSRLEAPSLGAVVMTDWGIGREPCGRSACVGSPAPRCQLLIVQVHDSRVRAAHRVVDNTAAHNLHHDRRVVVPARPAPRACSPSSRVHAVVRGPPHMHVHCIPPIHPKLSWHKLTRHHASPRVV